MDPKLSIVVAVKDGAANLPALLKTLRHRGDETEVILCCAGHESVSADNAVTQISLPAETLVPNLWSEGIMRARGCRVALTTAQFVPEEHWLARLSAPDPGRWAGVG